MPITPSLATVRDAPFILDVHRAAEDLAVAAGRDGGSRAAAALAAVATDPGDEVAAIAAVHALGRVFDDSADVVRGGLAAGGGRGPGDPGDPADPAGLRAHRRGAPADGRRREHGRRRRGPRTGHLGSVHPVLEDAGLGTVLDPNAATVEELRAALEGQLSSKVR